MIEQKTYHDTVLEAAKEVFETMIFMEIEPAELDPNAECDDMLMGSITFRGSLDGCLVVSLCRPCAEVVARNMLAMEPDSPISNEEVCDAVGEVANMVMGSIKSRILDTFPEIEVSIPSVITGRELTGPMIEGAEKTHVPVCIDVDYMAEFTFLHRINASGRKS